MVLLFWKELYFCGAIGELRPNHITVLAGYHVYNVFVLTLKLNCHHFMGTDNIL